MQLPKAKFKAEEFLPPLIFFFLGFFRSVGS